MFDPVANKWSYVASMNVTRSRVAVVSNMDRLWAIGGIYLFIFFFHGKNEIIFFKF